MNVWGITDKGIVRQQNQDTYYSYCDDVRGRALLLVCDGMGGANAGNVASSVAVDVFVEAAKQICKEDAEPNLQELMRHAFQTANSRVFEMSNSNMEYAGMGTTLVGAAISGDDTVVINAGDSRAYQISGGELRQITRDHSVVEDMIARGDITREASVHHPRKNLITRALGTTQNISCDVFEPDLKPGDYLLLCSDGLSNIVTDQEMLHEVTHSVTLEDACCNLFNLAMMRGAPDNVTVVLFKK